MSKVLSVRLNQQDSKKLEALAEDLDLDPSVLARMLLHSSLANLEGLKVAFPCLYW
jgi:predicted transcriptional regulator